MPRHGAALHWVVAGFSQSDTLASKDPHMPSDTPPTAPPQDSLLLRPSDAAKLLAISPRKLWELTNTGEVPVVRIGRCLRYPREELRLWISKRQGVRP